MNNVMLTLNTKQAALDRNEPVCKNHHTNVSTTSSSDARHPATSITAKAVETSSVTSMASTD